MGAYQAGGVVMALVRESRATELSISVLRRIITTIRNHIEDFSAMRDIGELSDEDYSLLETNLEKDIATYQNKIQQLSSTINQEKQWKS